MKGSIGFVSSAGLIPFGIKTYSFLREKIEKKYLCSHCFLVHENGIIYESNMLGNEPRHISKYHDKKFKVYIFKNINLTEENYQTGLIYSTGSLGRRYDYSGLFRFVLKFIPQGKYLDFCSEFLTLTVRNYYKLPLCPTIKKEYDVTPSAGLKYCFSGVGKNDGWQLEDYW